VLSDILSAESSGSQLFGKIFYILYNHKSNTRYWLQWMLVCSNTRRFMFFWTDVTSSLRYYHSGLTDEWALVLLTTITTSSETNPVVISRQNSVSQSQN